MRLSNMVLGLLLVPSAMHHMIVSVYNDGARGGLLLCIVCDSCKSIWHLRESSKGHPCPFVIPVTLKAQQEWAVVYLPWEHKI